MLPYRESRITKLILVAFFLLVAAYAYFEGRALLWGPRIAIENRVMTVYEPYIAIEGRAERISSLSMNGKSISVTEDGNFSEPYVLSPGYNRIMLEARDRFGKTTERSLEIVYIERETASDAASSTDSTSSPQADSTSSTTLTTGSRLQADVAPLQ